MVNLKAIEQRFDAGADVTPETLVKAGLIPNTKLPVKVLGEGELKKKFNVTAAKFSKAAQEKIANAGGTVTVVEPKRATKAEGASGGNAGR